MDNSTKLTTKANAARNAYAKAWRAKNKDKIREANRRYWERKAAELEQEEKENAGRSIDSHADGSEV